MERRYNIIKERRDKQLTIRITRKTGDLVLDGFESALAKFFYGVYLAMQILFPAMIIYGIWLAITSYPIAIVVAIMGVALSITLFYYMAEEEAETVFRKINNKLHIFGWKDDVTPSENKETGN